MRQLLLSVTICLLSVCANQAFAAPLPPYLSDIQWTSVGPGGGGAQYNPAIAPGNPSLMYGFCDMGGVYRSTDGGRNWHMLSFDEAQMPVAYSPVHCNPSFALTNGSTCFIGLGEGLKRTKDGGLTWEWSAQGTGATAVKVDGSDADVVFYADSANRMFKSADGGDTWTEVASWASTVGAIANDIYIDPTTSSASPTVYASTSDGMFKSTNGGAAWVSADGNLPSTSISDFNAGTKSGSVVLYVALTGVGVYKSTDGGTTWTAANNGFNVAAAGHMELGVCESNADILYVGSQEQAGPTIYKSTNGGANWALALIDPTSPSFPAGVTVERDWMTLAFGWGWGEEPHEIEVCPTDGNVVAFSEDGRTWRSDNGGAHWFCCNDHETSAGSNRWTSAGFETTTNYFVHFAPWNHSKAYITYTDIGFFRSQDGGTSWTPSTSGSPYRNTFYDVVFDPTISGKMWAVSSNNHDIPHEKTLRSAGLPTYTGAFLCSTDSGATWTNLGHPLGGGANGAMTSIIVDPSSTAGSRTIYVAVMGHGVYKSTNDGASWTAVNNGLGMPNNMNAWRLKMMPDGTLYCALTEAMSPSYNRYPGALFKSTNAGASWTKVNTSQVLPYIYGFDVDPDDQRKIYVASFQTGGEGQGIWVTTDGGATWDNTLTGCDMSDASIDPEVHTRIYATMEQGEDFSDVGGIYISEDSGATWNKLPGMPFERYGPNYVSYDPDDSSIIYVTTFGGGVFKATVPHADTGISGTDKWLLVDRFMVATPGKPGQDGFSINGRFNLPMSSTAPGSEVTLTIDGWSIAIPADSWTRVWSGQHYVASSAGVRGDLSFWPKGSSLCRFRFTGTRQDIAGSLTGQPSISLGLRIGDGFDQTATAETMGRGHAKVMSRQGPLPMFGVDLISVTRNLSVARSGRLVFAGRLILADGFNPATDGLTLDVGPFHLGIPAGTATIIASGRTFTYKSFTDGGGAVVLTLTPAGKLRVTATKADMSALSRDTSVSLAISGGQSAAWEYDLTMSSNPKGTALKY